MTKCFYHKISEFLDKYCPVRQASSRKFPEWFSSNNIGILKRKTIYHRRWKRFKNSRYRDFFKRLRTDLKENIATDYDVHINEVEDGIRGNVREFWKFVMQRHGIKKRFYFRLFLIFLNDLFQFSRMYRTKLEEF